MDTNRFNLVKFLGSVIMITPGQLIIVVLLIIASYLIGSLKTKVEFLEKAADKSINVARTVTPSPTLPATTAENVPPVNPNDHIRGSRNARLVLIEYSDMECPFCKTFHPTVKQVLANYKDQVMWVYRHFPLAFHANAQKEAEASECANELGGVDIFWKYIDAIYERTTSNGTGFALDKLAPLAAELGLNETKFKSCLDSDKYTQHVKSDMDGGAGAGINGTPGNIILDTKTQKTRLVPGAVSYDQIRLIFEEMLK